MLNVIIVSYMLIAQEKINTDQFWKVQNPEVKVVQNRLYNKNQRWFLHIGYGQILNDAFSSITSSTIAGGYYFSEHWGVEIGWTGYISAHSAATRFMINNSVYPNHNKPKSDSLARLLIVPFYGKLALFERMILHFDLQLTTGIYNRQYSPFSQTMNLSSGQTLGYQIGVIQNIFVTRNWSLRWDYGMNFLNEKIYNATNGQFIENNNKSETFINLGISYLL